MYRTILEHKHLQPFRLLPEPIFLAANFLQKRLERGSRETDLARASARLFSTEQYLTRFL